MFAAGLGAVALATECLEVQRIEPPRIVDARKRDDVIHVHHRAHEAARAALLTEGMRRAVAETETIPHPVVPPRRLGPAGPVARGGAYGTLPRGGAHVPAGTHARGRGGHHSPPVPRA